MPFLVLIEYFQEIQRQVSLEFSEAKSHLEADVNKNRREMKLRMSQWQQNPVLILSLFLFQDYIYRSGLEETLIEERMKFRAK